jgi:hypothetical protein
MSSDPRGVARRSTEASLGGVAADLPDGVELPTSLLTPLAVIGDALRIGIDLPHAVRHWLSRRSHDELRAAAKALAGEVASLRVPAAHMGDADDPMLAGVLRRRDEAESVVIAVRRATAPSGTFADEWPEMQALEDAVVDFDERARPIVGRSRVESLLGARLGVPRRWVDAFDEAPVEPSRDVPEIPAEALATFRPSDEVIARYVTRGAFARVVEGAASANPEFGDDLTACIDAFLAARDQVGLVARRWRMRSGASRGEGAAAIVVQFVPHVHLAASTSPESRAETTTVPLGPLSPLDAEARVVFGHDDATVEVFAGDVPVARLEIGGLGADAADADGVWRVRFPRTGAPVRLRVVDIQGRESSEDIAFEAVEPLDEPE